MWDLANVDSSDAN